MVFYWSNNSALRVARFNEVQRVDLTTPVQDLPGGPALGRIDNGNLARHTKIFVRVLCRHIRSESGFLASALIESFTVPMASIVTVLANWMPPQTLAYFRNTHRAWDGMVLDVLQHIVRPAWFASSVDAISDPSYDFFLEMKALGIPMFLQVLQVLQPSVAAQFGVQASADVSAAVRSYMSRF
jgi:hypothetical protein